MYATVTGRENNFKSRKLNCPGKKQTLDSPLTIQDQLFD